MGNLRDPEKVEVFHSGGLSMAARHDVEVWCFASVGNAVCWPRTAPAGGRPCRIGCKIFRLCESTHSFLANAGESERDRAAYLANAAHSRVQAAVDSLIAEG